MILYTYATPVQLNIVQGLSGAGVMIPPLTGRVVQRLAHPY